MNSVEAKKLEVVVEMTVGTDKKNYRDISFYEAFDRFQADNDVNENDEEIFYGSVFQEFNEQWQGKIRLFQKKIRSDKRGESGFFKAFLRRTCKAAFATDR